MNNKKIIVIVLVVLGLIIFIGGGSYAFFNYYQVSNISNILVAGDIRLNITEGSDTITLTNVFPETKEEARSHDGNTLTFTLSGANTSSKAIGYNILLNKGNSKSGKTRFRDNELRFDLIEIINNEEVYLVENQNFNTLSDTSIYDNIVPGSTNSVSHTYKLRVWVDESVIISETESGNHVYTPNEYKDLYATVKIAVKGETVEGETKTVTFDADGGVVPINSKNVVVGQDYGYLPTPTKEGYTFMGWNGKNKLRIDNIYNYNNWHSDIATEGSYPTNNGNRGYLLSLLPNKSYSIQITTQGNDENSVPKYLYLCEYENNIGYLNSYLTTTILTKNSYTFTTNNNFGYYLRIGASSTADAFNEHIVRLTSIQLEEGDTVTEYEPYFVTSDTKVTEWNTNYVLKAIWQQNS